MYYPTFLQLFSAPNKNENRFGMKKKGGKEMHPLPCTREVIEACCCACTPYFLSLSDDSQKNHTTSSSSCDFLAATAFSLYPNTQFTNHESLFSLHESFSNFIKAYPQYSQTDQADQLRASEYYHLSVSNHVCLDYVGHGLFSYSQTQSSRYRTDPMIASSSSDGSELTSFKISHRSVNFNGLILYGGGQESEFESKMRKRIMGFLNISEDDYSMVFTANQSSAFKLVADAYPFHTNRNILTVYDYQSEAIDMMIESSKRRGAHVMSAEFAWPNLRIQSGKLMKMVVSKRKKKGKGRGLFVFPLQSRMTGSRYSYLWMSLAQENGWHVLLDACALGPKDMDTLGLSLFRPDFLICSFYKVFGENPTGFGCLFVKKSSVSSVLKENSNAATSIGIVKLVPTMKPLSKFSEKELGIYEKFESQKEDLLAEPSSELGIYEKFESQEEDLLAKPSSASQSASELGKIEEIDVKQKGPLILEIADSDDPIGRSEIKCRGLDHADALGLILISTRVRYLINWLVNALMSLRHPNSECRLLSLVRIYGPKIKFERAHAVAFNVFDWKGEKVDPNLVQKLADRYNISLSVGFLGRIWFSDKYEEERERMLSVVTAALGFLNNFEDVYRLWAFVSKFLDADFVEKERWRYMALNQKTVEV